MTSSSSQLLLLPHGNGAGCPGKWKFRWWGYSGNSCNIQEMRQQLTACQCPRHTRRIRNIILGPSPTPIFLTLEIIATLPLAFYSDPRIPGSPDPDGGSWFGPWRSSSSWAPLFVATNAVIIIYTVSTFYGVAILKCN